MDQQIQLAEQFTVLAVDLSHLLQTVWQFDAIVTFAIIGWALSVRQGRKALPQVARIMVGACLVVFYALNAYVLWDLTERLESAQSLARRYSNLTTGGEFQTYIDRIYRDFPDHILFGSLAIGAAVVVIVLVLLRPHRPRES